MTKGDHISLQVSLISHNDEEEKGFSKITRDCLGREKSQQQPGRISGVPEQQPAWVCMLQCCRKERRKAALQLACLHQVFAGYHNICGVAQGLMPLSFPRQCCQCSACEGICLALFLPLPAASPLCQLRHGNVCCLVQQGGEMVGCQACLETRAAKSPIDLQESLHLELKPLCAPLPYTPSQPLVILIWEETT